MVSWLVSICILLLAGTSLASEDEKKFYRKCEPNKVKAANHFVTNYNMYVSGKKFIRRIAHFSNQTFPDVTPGTLDLELEAKQPHAYIHIYNVMKTGAFLSYRLTDYTAIFNFYHGDSATCHQFNPKTREYTKQEIGFHTANYFCVFQAGNYQTVTFDQHRKEFQYAFLGVTAIRGNGKMGNIVLRSKEDVLKIFPEQAEIIKRINVSNV